MGRSGWTQTKRRISNFFAILSLTDQGKQASSPVSEKTDIVGQMPWQEDA